VCAAAAFPQGGTLKALATTLFDRVDYLAHWLTKNPDPDKELGQGSHAKARKAASQPATRRSEWLIGTLSGAAIIVDSENGNGEHGL